MLAQPGARAGEHVQHAGRQADLEGDLAERQRRQRNIVEHRRQDAEAERPVEVEIFNADLCVPRQLPEPPVQVETKPMFEYVGVFGPWAVGVGAPGLVDRDLRERRLRQHLECEQRFEYIENALHERGQAFDQTSIDELEELWQEAKRK